MQSFEEISIAVEKGKAREIGALVNAALETASAEDVLNRGLLPGMETVGEKFRENKIFVPEVMLAARTLTMGLDILKPHLASEGSEPCGKAVVCTVSGDRHDIGKNLVKMMLVGAGFEVIDLGVSAGEDKIVSSVREHKPDILALSALLTTTMKNQQAAIQALANAGLRDSVKVMVGGAPVTEEFAREIGADGYASDAASAAEVAKRLIGR